MAIFSDYGPNGAFHYLIPDYDAQFMEIKDRALGIWDSWIRAGEEEPI